MPKRKCIFNDQLQKEFDYVKKGKANMTFYARTAAVNFQSHGGRSDIKDHLQCN